MLRFSDALVHGSFRVKAAYALLVLVLYSFLIVACFALLVSCCEAIARHALLVSCETTTVSNFTQKGLHCFNSK